MKTLANLFLGIQIFVLRRRAARDYRRMLKARKQAAELIRLSRRDIELRRREIRRISIRVGIAKAKMKRPQPDRKRSTAAVRGHQPLIQSGQALFSFVA